MYRKPFDEQETKDPKIGTGVLRYIGGVDQLVLRNRRTPNRVLDGSILKTGTQNISPIPLLSRKLEDSNGSTQLHSHLNNRVGSVE